MVRLTKTQTAHDEKWDKIVNCALFIYQQQKINKLKTKIRQTWLLKYHHDYSTNIAVWLQTTDWGRPETQIHGGLKNMQNLLEYLRYWWGTDNLSHCEEMGLRRKIYKLRVSNFTVILLNKASMMFGIFYLYFIAALKEATRQNNNTERHDILYTQKLCCDKVVKWNLFNF